MAKEIITGKRKFTPDQEFQMMKMVLDKFLWIGVVVIVYGAYLMAVKSNIIDSLLMMVVGIVMFIIFMAVLVRDYEWAKRSK